MGARHREISKRNESVSLSVEVTFGGREWRRVEKTKKITK